MGDGPRITAPTTSSSPPAAIDAIQTEVIGDQQRDRTPSGLWRSDHAGSVASLRLARGT